MDPALAARFARQKEYQIRLQTCSDLPRTGEARPFAINASQEKLERGDEDVAEIGSQANHKTQLDPVLAQRWDPLTRFASQADRVSRLCVEEASLSWPGEVASWKRCRERRNRFNSRNMA